MDVSFVEVDRSVGVDVMGSWLAGALGKHELYRRRFETLEAVVCECREAAECSPALAGG